MKRSPQQHEHTCRHRIEIKLRDVAQLFNTMDPSPFHEKDLDADAEEFILSRAEEFHPHDPVALVIQVDPAREGGETAAGVERAVRRHFLYRSKLSRLELRSLLRDARTSLLIGALFLGACVVASELLAAATPLTVQRILSEGLQIVGWVAMWRPLQMCLYDWWPVRRRIRMFKKMSRITVQVLEKQPR